MSFSGKRYKRVKCENVEQLMRLAGASEKEIEHLKDSSAVFSFTKMDDQTYIFTLQTGDRVSSHSFELGKEHEVARRNGDKVQVTYYLEEDNVISQTIKQPDGKVQFFRREFGDKDVKMTISVEGSDTKAYIYYEQISQ